MSDDRADENLNVAKTVPWDFKHWGDPDDYVGYDPEANYVDTLDTTLLDSVRDVLLDAQDKGRIQNVRSHSDDPRLSNLDEPVQSLTITTQDARALLEIASTVEDKDRHEHEAWSGSSKPLSSTTGRLSRRSSRGSIEGMEWGGDRPHANSRSCRP
jgi:hypothetical protein